MTANDNNHRGLLPAGLADLLPPDAARARGGGALLPASHG